MTLQRGWHASNELLPTAEEVLDNLQSLVLGDATNGDFGGPLDVFGEAGVFTDQFVQLFLFSIVNNFAGLGGMRAKVIIKFISQHELIRSKILCHLRNGVSTISSRALVEKLLEAAIEACDADTVRDLLALKVVRPDDIVFVDYEVDKTQRRTTPVEKASRLRDYNIVGLLLGCDADVNKTYAKSPSPHERGALECAIGLWGVYRPIDIKLVDLLLNNGATVSGKLMGTVIRWGDAALVEKLMSRISPSEHVYCFERVVNDAAEYLRNDMGYKFVRQIMQACRDMHNNECIGSKHGRLVEAMCKAARRNNRDLLDLLLPHGGQEGLDSALTAAAQFGSHSLVRLLIAHGARGNTQARRIDDSIPTTPLAEAIRRGDDDLVAIFAKEGAWDQIGEPGSLEVAMHAIAESGNLAYLLEVLRLVPNPSPSALGSALYPAIKAGHEEFALGLLDAGADPTTYTGPNRSPLIEALRIKSKAITWAILDSDISSSEISKGKVLEAAIAWGDLDILKAIFFMRGGVNNYLGRPPLSFAIKSGNKSIIELMINLGANLSIYANPNSLNFPSPLAAAVLVRDRETANYLLDQGANPADEPAIINAISHDRRLLDLILESFRQRYPQGRTGFGGRVLLHALQTQDEAALDLCLRAGFDVNNMVEDMYGKYQRVTALGIAIQNHHSRGGWFRS